MGFQTKVEEYDPDAVVYERIPAGTIALATLEGIEAKDIAWLDKVEKGDDGQPLRRTATLLQWTFRLTDGDYAGKTVRGTCDSRLSTHPKNVYRNWAETLLARELPVNGNLDTDDLIGLEAKVLVKHKVDKKDDTKVYVEVDELLPSGGGFQFSDEPPF